MTEKSYDCTVIGAGPGGYVAAIRASQLGLKTAIIEKESPGGVCLNWGCIPTKTLLKSADILEKLSHAEDYGIRISGFSADLPTMIHRSRNVVAQMSKGVEFLIKKNKIDLIMGTATFVNPKQIEVRKPQEGKEIISFTNAVIATGGRAKTFPGLTVDGKRIIRYREAVMLEQVPEKLLIIGAGAIGMEFASFYNALGSKVTVVELMDRILPLEDRDISKEVKRQFLKKGIEIKTSSSIKSINSSSESVEAIISSAGEVKTWKGNICLVAVGIQGNVDGSGLENIGIKVDHSFISVDEFYRTSCPEIYAIGDVIGPPLLAHVASHEGIIAIEHMVGKNPCKLNYKNIPACTFCNPQVASVGYTEDAAKEEGYELKIGKFPFAASGRAVAAGESGGFIKVVLDSQTEEVLGIHIVHSEASELSGEAAIICSHEGIGSSVLNTIHPHPTLNEGIMEAMGVALGRAIHI